MTERYESFTSLIFMISRYIFKLKSKEVESLGLKSSHVTCLYYLYNANKEMTSTDIKNISGEDKAVISRAVDYLKKEGFLVIDSKTEKAYRSPLILTEKGKDAGKRITTIIEGVLEKASIGITEDERVILYKSLNIIEKNLERIYNEEL